MNVSFARPTEVSNGTVQSEPSGPATSIPSTSALIVPQVAAVPANLPPVFYDDNTISMDDIIVPRLNAVQRVGELSEVFSPGELVLNQTTVLHTPKNVEKNIAGTAPLIFVPIGKKRTQYCEKVPGGGKGLFVNSIEEVTAAGGCCDWKEWKASLGTANPKRRFEPYITFLLLIKQPKELLPDEQHQVFGSEIEGEYYTLALLGCKGTWHSGLAKRLMTERKIGFLKGGYPTFSFTLSSESKSFPNDEGGKNYAHVPVLGNGTRSTPALLQYVKDGLGFGS